MASKRPPSLEAAHRAVDVAIQKLRAEQARRGKVPSREVQLAITNAQQARQWLREVDEIEGR